MFAALLLVEVLLLAAWSWGRWGDVTIDCGREMLVPQLLLQGKQLYGEIWYPYGPLAPWIGAAIYSVFGSHLSALYVSNLLLVCVYLLMYYAVARRLVAPGRAFLVATLAALLALRSGLFSFVLPYSHAGWYGQIVLLAVVLLLLRGFERFSRWETILAGILTGVIALLKVELAATALVLLGIAGLLQARRSSSLGPARDFAAAIGLALAVAAAGYWPVFQRYSWRFMFDENFMSLPGTYFVRVHGATYLANTGFIFSWTNLAPAWKSAAVAAAGWVLLSWVSTLAVRWLILGAVAELVVLAAVALAWPEAFLGQVVPRGANGMLLLSVPRGAAWFAIVAAAAGLLAAWRHRARNDYAALALVAVTGCLSALRALNLGNVDGYFAFYGKLVILTYFACTCWMFDAITRRVRAESRAPAFVATWVVLVVLVAAVIHGRTAPTGVVETPAGSIVLPAAKANAYSETVSFLRAEARRGRRFLSLPEDTALYFLAGVAPPSRWYVFVPGVLPDGEPVQRFVREMEVQPVDYVLISNRTTFEYGPGRIGIDYYPEIQEWLDRHYHPIRIIGSPVRENPREWGVTVYARNAG